MDGTRSELRESLDPADIPRTTGVRQHKFARNKKQAGPGETGLFWEGSSLGETKNDLPLERYGPTLSDMLQVCWGAMPEPHLSGSDHEATQTICNWFAAETGPGCDRKLFLLRSFYAVWLTPNAHNSDNPTGRPARRRTAKFLSKFIGVRGRDPAKEMKNKVTNGGWVTKSGFNRVAGV